MPSFEDQASNRRKFLQFLAASPLWAAGGFQAFAGEGPTPGTKLPDPMMWAPLKTEDLIKSPKEAINVFDFEPVMRARTCRRRISATWRPASTTRSRLRANREGFLKFELRPRRLVDVSKVDMSVEILGVKYPSPIVVCADRRQQGLPPGRRDRRRQGGARPATICKFSRPSPPAPSKTSPPRAARRSGTSSTPPTSGRSPRRFVTRAEKAGCPVVVVTVDRSGGRNQETLFRLRATDTRDCTACHDRCSLQANLGAAPMYEGVDLTRPDQHPVVEHDLGFRQTAARHHQDEDRAQGHAGAGRTRCSLPMPASTASSSPTTARAARTVGRSTIDALPEIVEAVKGRMPVLVDSGFRRGTDIVKALCMGATAVCVGRPYIVGSRRLRPARRRARARALAHRDLRDDAAGRRAQHQGASAGDGEAGVAIASNVSQ